MSFFLLLGSQVKQLTVAAPAFDFSLVGPALPSGVALTRATIGTYIDINGHVVTAPVNQPRFEYTGATGIAVLPPVVANDAYTTTQSTALTVAAPGVLANDTDPQAQALVVNSFDTASLHGTVACNNDGSFTYTPVSGYSGTDPWTYNIRNVSGLVSASRATVTMTVTAVVNLAVSLVWAGPVAGSTLAGPVTFTFTGANLVNVEVFGPNGRLTATNGSASATLNAAGTTASFTYNSALDVDGSVNYSAHAWNSPAGTAFTSEADAGTRSFVIQNNVVTAPGTATTGQTFDLGYSMAAPAVGPNPAFLPVGGKGGPWTPVLNLTFGTTIPASGGGPGSTVPLPTLATSLNITATPYNASTGAADNTAAINQACADAKAQGKNVFVPPGTFNHGNLILVDGNVTIWGQYPNSILHSTDARIDNNAAIRKTGVGGGVMGLVMNNITLTRGSQPSTAGIHALSCSNFIFQGNGIHGGNATGIFHEGAFNGTTQYNWVTDTLADSIHHTFASHDIYTGWNRIERAGDDGVSTVSYSGNPGPCVNITSDHNTVINSLGGRGLSVIGGTNCHIQNCHVENTAGGSGGVIVACEAAFPSYPTIGIVVSGNTIKNCGGNGGHGSIEFDSSVQNQQCTVTGNQLSQDRGAVVQFNGPLHLDITATNNTDYGTHTFFNGPLDGGSVTFVANTNNVQLAAASYPGDIIPAGGGPAVMPPASTGTLNSPTITSVAALGNYVVGCNNTGGPPTPTQYGQYGSVAVIPASWNQLDKSIFVSGGNQTPRQNGFTTGEQYSIGTNYLRITESATVTGNVGPGQVVTGRFSPALIINPRLSGVDCLMETQIRVTGQAGQALPFYWLAWWFAGQPYDLEIDCMETFGFNNLSPKTAVNQNNPCELAHSDAVTAFNSTQSLSTTTSSGAWTLNFDFRQFVTMQMAFYANGTWQCNWSGTLSDGTTATAKATCAGTYSSTSPIGLIVDNGWFGPSGNSRPPAGTDPSTQFPFFIDYAYLRYWYR